jgi:hypothetical protein
VHIDQIYLVALLRTKRKSQLLNLATTTITTNVRISFLSSVAEIVG